MQGPVSILQFIIYWYVSVMNDSDSGSTQFHTLGLAIVCLFGFYGVTGNDYTLSEICQGNCYTRSSLTCYPIILSDKLLCPYMDSL